MLIVMAILVGGLYAAGIYLLLRRTMIKLIFGLMLLGHAANLLIFTAGGLIRGAPPLVAEGASAPPSGITDPVPQALVLTSIVIGFAVTAFAAVLVRQVAESLGSTDSDTLRTTR